MSAQPQTTATLDAALGHGRQLLACAPALALEQAQAILEVYPQQPQAWLLAGHAQLALQRPQLALAAINRALQLAPGLPGGWLLQARVQDGLGDAEAAQAARLRHVEQAAVDPELLAAGAALRAGRIPEAETRLRARLTREPDDIAALRMLAELGARLGRNEEALAMLARCVALCPGFVPAREQHALLLDRCNRQPEALAAVDALLTEQPGNAGMRNLKAVVLGKLGRYAEAIALYESILVQRPDEPRVLTSYGHALKTEGRTPEAIAAYRRAIAADPGNGTAWWSLANLKTVQLTAQDIRAMQAQLARTDLSDEQRLQFEFALGKALEDAGDYADSFTHYARGNRLRRAQVPYDAALNRSRRRHAQAVYTAEFFAARAGCGAQAPDAIFIVGMPRAGSTLIEQILSSHPQVEATMELPEVMAISRQLRERAADPVNTSYHDIVATLDPQEFQALGEQYLQRTAVHRRRGTPLFIDKMPNNHAHVGLIRLMLPNAKVIDARRHPLACGFSNFKQHFARGQAFSYGLADMGGYYADYVALMAHFDAVLPGFVHRAIYEEVVADTEAQVRDLLAYCGLEFDERCLRFFENERAVRTASSEQVRRPIYREGVDHWRHYAAWLGPMEEALGPVLTSYPAVPPPHLLD